MKSDPTEARVLDHGRVVLLNLSGPVRRRYEPEGSWVPREFDADDIDPALVARCSFGAPFEVRDRELDLKLDGYLMEHGHTTPIEMIETWWMMDLPIFVARQFVRHRTAALNEVSGRYVQLPDTWYVPRPEDVGVRPIGIKQGRKIAWGELDEVQRDVARTFCKNLNFQCKLSYQFYQHSLAGGVPPEVARCALHLNHYTTWVWKIDLHNLFRFLSKRLAPDAQFEARAYGEAIVGLLRPRLPHLAELFDEFRR